ncbi:NADP-dependent oxidoreductase domain-containing protein [Lipomyces kononenkoae]|uniref:NADP-dependent oxidoreductase domain-containing protein n=1 Tax=Lipomyces kononenkoae TaxID=34357 RepID=A0ACC3SVQ2_LIPKO
MAFAPAPKPKSLLGYHRILSPTAGARVSPLCLGAMNFGNAWEGFMGKCDKKDSFAMLDYFYENGGNFIDTANNYQGEESETWIGEWMAERGNRDELVLATKFTTYYPGAEKTKDIGIRSNFQGNHSKSLKVSLQASLKKLQTDYIDLLYIHWWDFTTSIPEIMNSLNHLVASGKVLYLGISDTPAWIVSKANQYARDHGLTQFSVYQGHWSAAMRDFERDILPMCEAEGMALAPWGALGRGQFATEEELEKKGGEGRKIGTQSEEAKAVSVVLDKLAKQKNALITSIALAYVMHKAPYVFPIVGGRKIEQLKGNIDGLGIELTDDEIDEIDAAAPFKIGFPLSMLFEYGGAKYNTRASFNDIFIVRPAGHFDVVEKARPPKPHKD